MNAEECRGKFIHGRDILKLLEMSGEPGVQTRVFHGVHNSLWEIAAQLAELNITEAKALATLTVGSMVALREEPYTVESAMLYAGSYSTVPELVAKLLPLINGEV